MACAGGWEHTAVVTSSLSDLADERGQARSGKRPTSQRYPDYTDINVWFLEPPGHYASADRLRHSGPKEQAKGKLPAHVVWLAAIKVSQERRFARAA